jgi:nucleoside-diphosphate-sugar epimerase
LTIPAASIPRTIAVTGCTGFVGRYLVRELLSRGHNVRGLIRDVVKAREVFGRSVPAGLSTVIGDVCDPVVLNTLVVGCDAVIHLVGIIREERGESLDQPQTFDRIHVQATKAILDACQRAGVSRYLHMSALSVGPEGRSDYQKTKWAAEQAVRASGLDWTIFRPGLIHGPDGEFIQTMAELASGESPPWLFIPYFARGRVDHRVIAGAVTYEPANTQPIAVQDVAIAFANAIDSARAGGEVYNLVGPETLDWRELAEFLRDTLPGTKKSLGVWYIPGEHAAAAARFAKTIGLGKLLPFDEGQALMAIEDTTADPTKARADLNLNPRPFRKTVESYVSQV